MYGMECWRRDGPENQDMYVHIMNFATMLIMNRYHW